MKAGEKFWCVGNGKVEGEKLLSTSIPYRRIWLGSPAVGA